MPRVAKKLGSAIRAARNAANLSRESLAERSGLHPNYVGSIERGEINAGIENIAKIAKALRIPLHKLFLAVDGPADPATQQLWAIVNTADATTTRLAVELIHVLREWQRNLTALPVPKRKR